VSVDLWSVALAILSSAIGRVLRVKLDASFFTAVASGAAAVAAVGSAVAAFLANRTSSALAKTERERRHTELTPEFQVWCDVISPNHLKLTLWLRGPAGLDKIDRLTVSIRDNKRVSASPVGSPTSEQVDKQIWGPRRFSPHVMGASSDGRNATYLDLIRGDEAVFQLEKTPPGSWMMSGGTLEWWETLGISRAIKISIHCEKSGLEPWTVPWDIPLI
jgi:hypothetical protein